MIRVVIADDQALVRGGLRMIVEADPGIEVVGEAENGRAALDLIRQLQPDVVLMDIGMPVLDGIEATRALAAQPSAPHVIILTTFGGDEHVYDALRAGAAGFLLKDVRPEQLARAIHDAAHGDVLLAPQITRRLIEEHVRRPAPGDALPPALAELSARELDVLRSLARGRSNAEIAQELFLSEATVKTHVSNLLGKLGLRDRVQAVVLAYESGLIQPGEATA